MQITIISLMGLTTHFPLVELDSELPRCTYTYTLIHPFIHSPPLTHSQLTFFAPAFIFHQKIVDGDANFMNYAKINWVEITQLNYNMN